jgi:hypothetical protein
MLGINADSYNIVDCCVGYVSTFWPLEQLVAQLQAIIYYSGLY